MPVGILLHKIVVVEAQQQLPEEGRPGPALHGGSGQQLVNEPGAAVEVINQPAGVLADQATPHIPLTYGLQVKAFVCSRCILSAAF